MILKDQKSRRTITLCALVGEELRVDTLNRLIIQLFLEDIARKLAAAPI
jgi:hypothetical protein